MAKNNIGFKDFIPQVLRSTRDGEQLSEDRINALLPPYLSQELTLDESIKYMEGCVAFQDLAREAASGESDDISFFSGQILGVREIPISSNGEVYGHKARIFYWGKEYKGTNFEVQFIDTNFTGFENEWAERNSIWSVALARTLAKIAEDNVGKMGVFMKLLQKGQDSSGDSIRVRSVASMYARRVMDNDVTVDDVDGALEDYIDENPNVVQGNSGGGRGRSNNDGDSRGSRSRSGGGRSRKRGGGDESVADRVKKFSKDIDPDDEFFQKDDFKAVEGIFKGNDDPDNDTVIDAISEYLDIDADDLDKPSGRIKDPVQYALQLVYDNAPED